MLIYILYVAHTRRHVVPQVSGTVIYVHTLLDEAEGEICVGGHDPFLENLLDIRDLVEFETLLY